jgi:hypothetical protein
MSATSYAALFSSILFVGMLVLIEVGRGIGRRRLRQDSEGARAGLGAVEGSVFGLLGLLIAFTFSGAASRFDSRRELVTAEANDIGTAWLRLDLLPPDSQPVLRQKFREYLDARLAAYKLIPDLRAADVQLRRADALQAEIWKLSVKAGQQSGSVAALTLVLPALNQMFDITTSRFAATRTHPPLVVFALLGVLVLTSALLAGYGMAAAKSRSWTHTLGFAFIMAGTTYLILDLEFPRIGLIRVDQADELLQEVRRKMDAVAPLQ